MKTRIVLERFLLWLIIIFIVIGVFMFFSFIMMETFHWIIFPKLGTDFFELALPLISLAIFAFAVVSIALNAGIISTALLEEKKRIPDRAEILKTNKTIVVLLVGLLGLTVFSLFLINKVNVNSKIKEVKMEMSSFKRTNRNDLDELVEAFRTKQSPEEIQKILMTVTSNNAYFRDVAIIYPIRIRNRIVFKSYRSWAYERWNFEKNIKDGFFTEPSDDYGYVFQPNKYEMDFLTAMTKDKNAEERSEVFVFRPDFKIYSALKSKDNTTVLFLMSGGHRYGVNEYKM